jgi:hypothetical protein
MDAGGGNPNQFALQPSSKPRPYSVTALCASADGRVAAVRGENTIEIYSRAGELTRTIPIQRSGAPCIFDEEISFSSGNNLETVGGAQDRPAIAMPSLPKIPRVPLVDLLSFSDHRIAVLETSEGMLHVLDRPSGRWFSTPIAAPEFAAVRRLPLPDYSAVPLVMSPSVAGDDFFVLSNPTNRKLGAKVLRFDSHGTLRARYVCPLQMGFTPTTAGNPNGYFSPTSVVVIDRTLLLISFSQKAVAVYELN